MNRPDVTLAAISTVPLAALYAVSWRAEPSATDVVVILCVVAGLLEAGGVLTVGADLLGRRRRVNDYLASRRHIRMEAIAVRSRAALGLPTVSGGRPPDLWERVAALERGLAAERERLTHAMSEIRLAIDDAATGQNRTAEQRAQKREQELVELVGALDSLIPAWIGFALLLTGLLVATAANILSATTSPA